MSGWARVRDVMVTILLAVAIIAILAIAAFFVQLRGEVMLTAAHLNSLADQASVAIATANTASAIQIHHFGTLQKAAILDNKHFNENMTRTFDNINGNAAKGIPGVLPELAMAIRDTNENANGEHGLLPTATAQLQSTKPGIESFNGSMLELHDTLAQVGPRVVETAQSLKQTGANMQSATADGAQIMRETDAFLHQQYNPAKQTIAHKVLLMILNSIFNGGASGLARR